MAGMPNDKIDWVEFASLKQLFYFLVTHAMPMQQYASLTRYKDYTYVMVPYAELPIIFFTREVPKANYYKWNIEQDDFVPNPRLDKSSYNIIIQDALSDSLIEKHFYKS